MKSLERLMGLAFILALWPAAEAWSGETTSQAATARFGWLRVGEVKPRGWLLEQLRNDVRHGFASALDRLTDRCDLNTFDSRAKSELEQPKIGGVWWNGETTGNWLDGNQQTGEVKFMKRHLGIVSLNVLLFAAGVTAAADAGGPKLNMLPAGDVKPGGWIWKQMDLDLREGDALLP